MAIPDFVVGLDWGTTYASLSCRKTFSDITRSSGVGEDHTSQAAYVVSRDLIHISDWPDARNVSKQSEDEVPTEVLVDLRTKTVYSGWTVRKKQRSPVKEEDDMMYIRLQNLKLLLDSSDRRRADREDLTARLQETGYTLREILCIFLRFLLKHTKSRLTEDHGYCSASSVQLVATVPAIWGNTADDTMIDCLTSVAQELDFGHQNNIFLVSEPDAAATYFCQVGGLGHTFLDVGDTFVIADCGGGTADVVSYNLKRVYPTRIDEVVAGDGDLCGSAYVDRAFRVWLVKKLTTDQRYASVISSPADLDKIVDMSTFEFERAVKREFQWDDEGLDTVYLDVPGVPGFDGAYMGSMLEKREIIEEMFRPRLERIAALIRAQIDAAIRAGHVCEKVLIVGGFAVSNYLQGYMRTAFPECRVHFPKTADTAISDGAVIRYLYRHDGPSEILRSSYGFLTHEPYSPEQHEGHREPNFEPVRDEEDGKMYWADCITYFAEKGDLIPPGGKTFQLAANLQGESPMDLKRTFSSYKTDLTIRLEVFENRLSDHVKSHFSRFSKQNEGCVEVGHLEWVIPGDELRKIKREGYKTMPNGKRVRYYWIPYRVEFHKFGKNIHYELWINNSKKSVGRIHASTETGLDEEETEATLAEREEEVQAILSEYGAGHVDSLGKQMGDMVI